MSFPFSPETPDTQARTYQKGLHSREEGGGSGATPDVGHVHTPQNFCLFCKKLCQHRGGSRIFCRRGCTRLLLYFNTNKLHSFFCRIPVVLENRRSSQGGCAPPAPSPLDPPLQQEPVSSANDVFHLPKLLMSCHQTSKMPSRIFGGLQSFVRRQNPLFLASYPSSGHLISRT